MLATRLFLGCALLSASPAAPPQSTPPVKLDSPSRASLPNIVLVLVDDLGYGDLGCFGHPTIRTPHLDSLARDGVRCTDFYVSQPVCSASRASLLTGCYANRIGIHGALGPNAKHGLHQDEVTLAEICKQQGHATAAFGKWHLGHLAPFLPRRHGFDEFYGIPYSNDMHPAHPEAPKSYPPLPLIEGDAIVARDPDQDRFTHDFTSRAIDFITRSAARRQPFFVYLAQPMPHVPLHAAQDARGRSAAGLYGDVVEEIDREVGRILETLDRLELARDTLVLFISDNGPWLSYGNHAGSAGPLREGKGTTFEGGVRVPCLLRWPGHLPAGHVCRAPAMTIDVLPTLARLLGAELPPHPIDGTDIWPLLAGERDGRTAPDALFFWYHDNDLEAMRTGKWKLHFQHRYRSMQDRAPGDNGRPGAYAHGVPTGLALYDLEADPGERFNLAATLPHVVLALTARADRMRGDLGDRLTQRQGSGTRAAGRAQ